MDVHILENIEDAPLLQSVMKKGLLTDKEIEEVSQVEGLCEHLGLIPKTYQILLDRFGERSLFFSELLDLKLNSIFQEDWSLQFTRCITSVENEEKALKKLQEQGILTPETLKECQKVQEKLNRMGVAFYLPEILIKKGLVTPEDIEEYLENKLSPPPKVTVSSYTLKTKEGKNISPSPGKLAVLNKLITQEELDLCLAIHERLKKELNIKVPLERLLFEKLFLDRNIISSLIQVQLRLQSRILFERDFSYQLTETGDQFLEKQCKAANLISNDILKECKQLKKAFSDEKISFSLAMIMIQKKALKEEDIDTLAIPLSSRRPIPTGTPPRIQSISMDSDEDILLQNKLISQDNLEECIKLKKQFEEKYSFSLPVTKWLVVKGFVQENTIYEIQYLKNWLLVKDSLRYIYIKLSPEEEIFVSKKMGKYWGQATRSPEYLKLREILPEIGLSWSIWEYLLFSGKVPQEIINEILENRGKERQGTLYFPNKLQGDTPQHRLGSLAVANYYLSQEEYLECIGIEKKCSEDMRIPVQLEEIFLRKSYLTPEQIKSFFSAYQNYNISTEWSLYFYISSFPKQKEDRLIERFSDAALLSNEKIDEGRKIAEVLQAQKLSSTLIKVLLMGRQIDLWMMSDVFQDHLKSLGFEQQLVTLSIPRPPSSRITTNVKNDTLKLDKWKEHVLKGVLFGQIALDLGYILIPELDEALFLQRCLKEMGLNMKIGDILVDLGVISPMMVQEILSHQEKYLNTLNWPKIPFLDDQDYILCQAILEYRSTLPIEVKRCLYIQNKLKDLNIQLLLNTIIEKMGLLEKEIIRGQLSLYKNHIKSAVKTEQEKAEEEANKRATEIAKAEAEKEKKATAAEAPVQEEKKEEPPKVAHIRGAIISEKTIDLKFRKKMILCVSITVAVFFIWIFGVIGINVLHNRKERAEEKKRDEGKNVLKVERRNPNVCPICGGNITIVKECPRCKGKGVIPCFSDNELRCYNGYLQVRVGNNWYYARVPTGRCPRCNGVLHSEACPGLFGDRIVCPYCNGKGTRVCPDCQGKGTITFLCPECSQQKK